MMILWLLDILSLCFWDNIQIDLFLAQKYLWHVHFWVVGCACIYDDNMEIENHGGTQEY
jgi:hypothetical protein